MKYFCMVVLIAAAAVTAKAEERVFDDRRTDQVMANGLWLLGKAEQPSDSLAAYLLEHEDSKFPILKCGTPMLMDMKLAANQDRRAAEQSLDLGGANGRAAKQ